jgi:hypothetical protein
MHTYDDHFMDYAASSSRYSARAIVGILCVSLPIKSVLDVGCARGTWLEAWSASGVSRIHGVDGDYVDASRLLIPSEFFTSINVAQTFDLGERFDIVQSLEVAEHIPIASADIFVQSLVNHSNGFVLFSAAPPGQGGEFHINEQTYEYWRAKFNKLGFEPFDCIRPYIVNDPLISFWYRYNILLFVSKDLAETLPKSIATSRIECSRLIPDLSPPLFRLRKAVVRALPYQWRLMLARFKASFFQSGSF